MVKALVESGAQILKPRNDGATILHISTCLNDVHTLDYAIKAKNTQSIDLLMTDGYTPAH
jgi:hypothetical protein